MEKIFLDPLPEIVFASKEVRTSKAISRLVSSQKLRKIASRIYTSNFQDLPAAIIARNVFLIVGTFFPNGVISYRTALESKPAEDGSFFLTYHYTRNIRLPGLTIRLQQGPGPLPGDMPFIKDLYIASRPRAILENLQLSRSRSGLPKAVGQERIERLLDNLCKIHGPEELNHIRDQAKALAPSLQSENEFKQLTKIIGAILGTRESGILKSSVAIARAIGEPYDTHRLEVFAKLAAFLQIQSSRKMNNNIMTEAENQNLAFFEAYFSNYIEGTEFLVEEAAEIIFQNKIIPGRSDDSHDILGTFQIVSNRQEMHAVPNNAAELMALLKKRHALLMQARMKAHPGYFKEQINRAGQTVFVAPELVIGTLRQGFEYYQGLKPGFARAAYMMFLIAEIHPFTDGNGRIARIMMNAELVAANEARIIIPTVYREDYLLALRCLSRLQDPEPYVRMLEKAQMFSANISFSNYENAWKHLKQCNAFLEPHEGKLNVRR